MHQECLARVPCKSWLLTVRTLAAASCGAGTVRILGTCGVALCTCWVALDRGGALSSGTRGHLAQRHSSGRGLRHGMASSSPSQRGRPMAAVRPVCAAQRASCMCCPACHAAEPCSSCLSRTGLQVQTWTTTKMRVGGCYLAALLACCAAVLPSRVLVAPCCHGSRPLPALAWRRPTAHKWWQRQPNRTISKIKLKLRLSCGSTASLPVAIASRRADMPDAQCPPQCPPQTSFPCRAAAAVLPLSSHPRTWTPRAASERLCTFAVLWSHAARQRLCDYIKRAEYTTLFDFPTKGILQVRLSSRGC